MPVLGAPAALTEPVVSGPWSVMHAPRSDTRATAASKRCDERAGEGRDDGMTDLARDRDRAVNKLVTLTGR
jgi:hypothetical protein